MGRELRRAWDLAGQRGPAGGEGSGGPGIWQGRGDQSLLQEGHSEWRGQVTRHRPRERTGCQGPGIGRGGWGNHIRGSRSWWKGAPGRAGRGGASPRARLRRGDGHRPLQDGRGSWATARGVRSPARHSAAGPELGRCPRVARLLSRRFPGWARASPQEGHGPRPPGGSSDPSTPPTPATASPRPGG